MKIKQRANYSHLLLFLKLIVFLGLSSCAQPAVEIEPTSAGERTIVPTSIATSTTIQPPTNLTKSGRFEITRPDGWSDRLPNDGLITSMCSNFDECYAFEGGTGAIFTILEQDFNTPDQGKLLDGNNTLDNYVMMNIESLEIAGGEVLLRETVMTQQQKPAERIVFNLLNFATIHRFIYFDENSAWGFTASFIFIKTDGTEFQAEVDQVFQSFDVTQE